MMRRLTTRLQAVAIGLVLAATVVLHAQKPSTQASGQILPASFCDPWSIFTLQAIDGPNAVGLYLCSQYSPPVWQRLSFASEGAGVPAGSIVFLASGTCAAGWTEVAALSGKTIIGTVAANGDVGTTGGSDTITPTGTNTAPTFTGNSIASSLVSAGTPAGTNGTVSFTPVGTNATGTVTPLGTIAWPAGVPTNGAIAIGSFVNLATATTGNCAATNVLIGTGAANACKATAPNLTVPAEGHSGTLTSPTIAWPAGVPTLSGSSSVTSAEVFTGSAGTVPAETFTGSALGTHQHTTTATGTNSAPTFTGVAFDNRSVWVKLIACQKS
jgi:hypothetical protein